MLPTTPIKYHISLRGLVTITVQEMAFVHQRVSLLLEQRGVLYLQKICSDILMLSTFSVLDHAEVQLKSANIFIFPAINLGSCICEGTYAGSDCSINVIDGPVIDYVTSYGFCDRQYESDCTCYDFLTTNLLENFTCRSREILVGIFSLCLDVLHRIVLFLHTLLKEL